MTTQNALDMTPEQYAAARALAIAGKLPTVAAAPPPPPADTGTDASTSSTTTPPEPKVYGHGSRGVLDLSTESYESAKAAAIAEVDGGRAPARGYARFSNR
jgi:hypothetical protein